MAKDLAIVLNNGGINSAVASALAAQKYRLVFLHLAREEPSGSRVRTAYDQQVMHFKPYREHSLGMPLIEPTGRKSSVSADPRAAGALGLRLLELLPLLAVGARLATHYQAAAIYLGLRIGTQPDDLSTATEYVQIWGELLQLPCGQKELEIAAPLLELDPWQVIDLGAQISAPFDKTWSCLEEAGEPCWACSGCKAREAAFQQAAKPDPLHGPRKP